ncbi:MAG: 50S ribosomal protein L23 [Phycisphaerales bacterium]
MEAHYVIKRPLLTEKATMQAAEHNRYLFEVDKGARKDAIKKAIQDLYGVRVLTVATQNHRSRIRRTRFGYVAPKVTKKAYVKLHPDDKIELF